MGLQIHANIDASELSAGRVISSDDLRPVKMDCKTFKTFLQSG